MVFRLFWEAAVQLLGVLEDVVCRWCVCEVAILLLVGLF